MKYKIILAEDQHLIRDSLKLLFSDDKDFTIIGAASDGIEALELCRQHKPDLALLDIRMPHSDGLETAEKLKKEIFPCKIVLLTTFEEDESIRRALQLGVEGYILKDIEPELFRLALKGIMGGLHIYQPLPGKYMDKHSPNNKLNLKEYGLTERDMVFIRLITEGLGNKEIASRQKCSEGTVKNRVSSILNKMGLQARTQIAVYAIKNGLVRDLD